ncbi:SIMPL domain-containing protein [Nocardioides ferulae]|uniref:SIMPL domain-containing protein n=1 Tax=Nocardioides ferulae TaxID=2340821 RepID=UPI000EB12C39|nr:SIMPL domain-containing protein [Nocardioides ferulae]
MAGTAHDGTITLSIRGVAVTALAVLALATAYLIGDAGGDGAPAQAAPENSTSETGAPRVFTMRGTGEATAVPDQLEFTLTVTALRPSLDAALDSTSATAEKVLGVLGEHGVERRDVQTAGLSMTPEYDYPSSGPRVLRGYRVTQRSTVLVDELRDGGAAVSAAVDAGGNEVRVGDLRLRVGDPEEVLEQARTAAVEEATAKAEQYAAASGQQLGEVVTLREIAPGGRSPRDVVRELNMSYGAMDAARALPIRAGREELGVTVEVVWALD